MYMKKTNKIALMAPFFYLVKAAIIWIDAL